MLEGRAVVGETDMSQNMQDYAMLCACEALDLHEVTDYEAIARFIKTQFDKTYGVAWQCIVGFSFGSSITHVCGTFIYFHVEKLAFLLFKDALFNEDEDHTASGSGSGSYALFNQDQGHMGLACGKADLVYLKQ